MELETRICAGEKCNQEFRVLPHDKQIWHSVFCRDNHEGMGWKTIKTKLAKKDLSGKVALVAPSLPLNEDESKKLKEARNRWNGGPNAIGVAEIHARNLEKKIKQESSTITTVTGKKVLKDAHVGAKKIKSETTNIKGSVMQDSKKSSDQKSSQIALNEIPQSDLRNLSTVLDEERLGSMKLLNDSATQLMDLAKANKTDVATAIKCFSELRNVMKTKLDYLKFGKEFSNK